jgi:arsenate reductase
LKQRGIETSALRSQSWDDQEALSPDAVITVCDSAAGEQCPLWLGNIIKIHRGLPDPSRIEGTSAQRTAAFDAVIAIIERRIQRLLELDFSALTSGAELRDVLERIACEEQ